MNGQLRELINYLYNNISLPPQAVMVTFDDGFDDNYYYAYPILKKYAVPATMFISTSYIGQDEPIWFDWLASLFLAGSMNSIDIPLLKKIYIKGNYLDNYANFHDLIKIIREIGNENRLEILSQLRDDYSAYMSHIDTSESRFMNWEQIIELSKNDISIGSHTATHPIMSRLSHAEVRYELIQSKKDIETHTLINVNSFSYPTGQTSSFTDGVVEEVINAGYKVAYTYIHAVNKLPIKNFYKIKRLHIENEAHNSYFNSMMMFPAVFKD